MSRDHGVNESPVSQCPGSSIPDRVLLVHYWSVAWFSEGGEVDERHALAYDSLVHGNEATDAREIRIDSLPRYVLASSHLAICTAEDLEAPKVDCSEVLEALRRIGGLAP
jgi:hypothetical protein